MQWIKAGTDIAIFTVLGGMGFIALWISIERLLFFRSVSVQHYEDLTELNEALTRHMTTLYIVYSNAPYIGLLGTVVGIMITFYDMGASQSIDAPSIMTGLSLALKATALGLVVAIPTLVSYNGLMRRIDILQERARAGRLGQLGHARSCSC